jgi:hypothetical protein
MARDVEREIDELYRQPLEGFIAGRNVLASRLRKEDDRQASERVRALTKPGASAWAVNQVYWHDRPAFDALMEAGAQLRERQRAGLEGGKTDLQDHIEARRRAVAAATVAAIRRLAATGKPVSPEIRSRVSKTLEALSILSGLPSQPAVGRLADDVDPPGFNIFAGLVPLVPPRAETAVHVPESRHDARPPLILVASRGEAPAAQVRAGEMGRPQRPPAAGPPPDVRERGPSTSEEASRRAAREHATRQADRDRATREAERERLVAARKALADAVREAATRHSEAGRAEVAAARQDERARRARAAVEQARTRWDRAQREHDAAERAASEARAHATLTADDARRADETLARVAATPPRKSSP